MRPLTCTFGTGEIDAAQGELSPSEVAASVWKFQSLVDAEQLHAAM